MPDKEEPSQVVKKSVLSVGSQNSKKSAKSEPSEMDTRSVVSKVSKQDDKGGTPIIVSVDSASSSRKPDAKDGQPIRTETIDEISYTASPGGSGSPSYSTIVHKDEKKIKKLVEGADGDSPIPKGALLVHEKESKTGSKASTISTTISSSTTGPSESDTTTSNKPTTTLYPLTTVLTGTTATVSGTQASTQQKSRNPSGSRRQSQKRSTSSGRRTAASHEYGSSYKQATESKGNSKDDGIQVTKDDMGAISFKLPGRITHKTTIRLAHFPQGTEVINIEPPCDGPVIDECVLPIPEESYLIPPGANCDSSRNLMQHAPHQQQQRCCNPGYQSILDPYQQQMNQMQQYQSYYNYYSQYYRNAYHPYQYGYGSGNNGCYPY